MKLKFTFLILIFCVIFTSCSIGNSGVCIDWVDFIVLNDIHYTGNYTEGNKLDQDSIDKVIAKVKFTVSDNVNNPNYKVKNGDAAFLPKGTEIFKIKGYKPEFRIAVIVDGKWRVYEADTNPGAKKGEDLLDIEGKVEYIGINSETDGTTELAAIKENSDVENLVRMVLDAEVNQNNQNNNGERYFIAFHLLDGGLVTRSYWLGSGELSRGIMLPKEFGFEIKKVLSGKK